MAFHVRVPVGQPESETRRLFETMRPLPNHPAWRLIDHVRRILPFDHVFITGLDIEGHNVGTGVILMSDFPAGYITEYYSGNYFPLDPMVAHFRAGKSPVRDSDIFTSVEARHAGRDVINLVKKHGIGERTIAAVRHGTKLVGTVAIIGKRPLNDEETDLFQHVAACLHTAAAEPAIEALNRALKITRGELLCLGGAALGQTSEDIAASTGYSLETVNSYLKSAARKLGAANRTHAVAEAIRRHLIG